MKQYAVLIPQAGIYMKYDTIEEAKDAIAQSAYDLAKTLTLGSPYSIVTIDEEGEHWTTPDGQDVIHPNDILAQINSLIPDPI